MHFIQPKEFSETNVTSHAFQHISDWKIFLNASGATENAVVGHMRPAGLELDHAFLDS